MSTFQDLPKETHHEHGREFSPKLGVSIVCSIEWFLQSGPLPVLSRAIAPLIGCITPLNHLEGHLNRRAHLAGLHHACFGSFRSCGWPDLQRGATQKLLGWPVENRRRGVIRRVRCFDDLCTVIIVLISRHPARCWK